LIRDEINPLIASEERIGVVYWSFVNDVAVESDVSQYDCKIVMR